MTELSANMENAILVRARAQVGCETALANYRDSRRRWYDYGRVLAGDGAYHRYPDARTRAIVARVRWQALAEVLRGS